VTSQLELRQHGAGAQKLPPFVDRIATGRVPAARGPVDTVQTLVTLYPLQSSRRTEKLTFPRRWRHRWLVTGLAGIALTPAMPHCAVAQVMDRLSPSWALRLVRREGKFNFAD
jgi:hypothetical protein